MEGARRSSPGWCRPLLRSVTLLRRLRLLVYSPCFLAVFSGPPPCAPATNGRPGFPFGFIWVLAGACQRHGVGGFLLRNTTTTSLPSSGLLPMFRCFPYFLALLLSCFLAALLGRTPSDSAAPASDGRRRCRRRRRAAEARGACCGVCSISDEEAANTRARTARARRLAMRPSTPTTPRRRHARATPRRRHATPASTSAMRPLSAPQ